MPDLPPPGTVRPDCGSAKDAAEFGRNEYQADGFEQYRTALSTGSVSAKQCTDCGQVLPSTEFYWVSKSLGTLRGQCKACMRRSKAAQRDPAWTPSCSRCSVRLPERTGSGRRLCDGCFGQTYDLEHRRTNGAHRVRLRPCSLCGGPKERMARGKMCQACKPWAGYAKSLRRFGLTPADYVAILQAQGGVCYICYEPARGQRLSIDHDHALPEGRAAVRGLLCRDCNYSRLPRFAEDVAMLQRAISYLTAPPARSVIAEGAHLGVRVRPTDLGLSATGEDGAT